MKHVKYAKQARTQGRRHMICAASAQIAGIQPIRHQKTDVKHRFFKIIWTFFTIVEQPLGGSTDPLSRDFRCLGDGKTDNFG